MFKKIGFFLFVAGASLAFNQAAHSAPTCAFLCGQLRAICLDENRGNAYCKDEYDVCLDECRNGRYPEMPQ